MKLINIKVTEDQLSDIVVGLDKHGSELADQADSFSNPEDWERNAYYKKEYDKIIKELQRVELLRVELLHKIPDK